MVLESFLFGLGGVLLLLIVLVGFRRLTYLRGRAAMKRELTRFLDIVRATSDPLAVAHAKPLVAIAHHDRTAPRRPVETHRP